MSETWYGMNKAGSKLTKAGAREAAQLFREAHDVFRTPLQRFAERLPVGPTGQAIGATMAGPALAAGVTALGQNTVTPALRQNQQFDQAALKNFGEGIPAGLSEAEKYIMSPEGQRANANIMSHPGHNFYSLGQDAADSSGPVMTGKHWYNETPMAPALMTAHDPTGALGVPKTVEEKVPEALAVPKAKEFAKISEFQDPGYTPVQREQEPMGLPELMNNMGRMNPMTWLMMNNAMAQLARSEYGRFQNREGKKEKDADRMDKRNRFRLDMHRLNADIGDRNTKNEFAAALQPFQQTLMEAQANKARQDVDWRTNAVKTGALTPAQALGVKGQRDYMSEMMMDAATKAWTAQSAIDPELQFIDVLSKILPAQEMLTRGQGALQK